MRGAHAAASAASGPHGAALAPRPRAAAAAPPALSHAAAAPPPAGPTWTCDGVRWAGRRGCARAFPALPTGRARCRWRHAPRRGRARPPPRASRTAVPLGHRARRRGGARGPPSCHRTAPQGRARWGAPRASPALTCDRHGSPGGLRAAAGGRAGPGAAAGSPRQGWRPVGPAWLVAFAAHVTGKTGGALEQLGYARGGLRRGGEAGEKRPRRRRPPPPPKPPAGAPHPRGALFAPARRRGAASRARGAAQRAADWPARGGGGGRRPPAAAAGGPCRAARRPPPLERDRARCLFTRQRGGRRRRAACVCCRGAPRRRARSEGGRRWGAAGAGARCRKEGNRGYAARETEIANGASARCGGDDRGRRDGGGDAAEH
jgi:hypothetical protein